MITIKFDIYSYIYHLLGGHLSESQWKERDRYVEFGPHLTKLVSVTDMSKLNT